MNMKKIRTVASVAAPFAVFLGLYAWSDLWMGTYLHNYMQRNAMWGVPFLVLVAGVTVVVLAGRSNDRKRQSRPSRSYFATRNTPDPADQAKLIPLWVMVVAFAVAAVGGIAWIAAVAAGGYMENQAYLDATKVTSAEQPSFQQRAAYDIAKAQAPGSLGTI